MLFIEGNVPDFGSIQMKSNDTNIYYLLAQDIPKLNGMLTKAAARSYLSEGESFDFHTGTLAYVVDYKTAGSGKIYAYHRGKDHWYEFNIRSDLGLWELMWNRHERILRETKTISGTPPLTFKSNGRPLKNYRIYGNTVNGESVGDLVTEGEHTGEYCIPVIVNDTPINIFMQDQLRKIGEEADHIDYQKQKMYRIRKNLWNEEMEAGGISNDGRLIDSTKRIRSDYIDVEPAKTYTFSSNLKIRLIYSYDKDNNRVDVISDSPLGNTSYTFTIPNNAVKIRIALMDRRNNVEYDITTNDFQWGQLEAGQNATDHEVYIENTEVSVSLPAVYTSKNTNTLRIDTTVLPSKIKIKGSVKYSPPIEAGASFNPPNLT